jgi:multiple sugar transport system substrate-binding protein
MMLIGGCTSVAARQVGPGGLTSAPGSGTIVWLAGPQTNTASDDVRQVLIDAFEQAYPSIKVDLVTGPNNTDTLRATVVADMSRGDAIPDIYSGDVTWPAEFAARGLALPLSRYLPASFWSRFGAIGSSRSLVQAMTYHGAQYAAPYYVDEGFLYYRKDLLARAGLPPPATWEQLEHDALVLRSKGLPYQFAWQGSNYEGLTCDWYEMMADAFGQLPPGASPAAVAADLDSPQSLRALAFLRDLISQGTSPKDVNSFTETQADNAFDSGQVAFLRSWDSSYSNAMTPTSATASPADVGVEPPPTFAGQQGPGWSVIGGWNLFVSPHTQHLRADLTFITWMTGVQAQRIIATQPTEIPANVSVRADPSVIAASPVLQAAAGTRLISRPSANADYSAISREIFTAIYSALPSPFSAGADPCTALVSAARGIDPRVHGTLRCPAPAAS